MRQGEAGGWGLSTNQVHNLPTATRIRGCLRSWGHTTQHSPRHSHPGRPVPMEVRRARTASEICSNCTFAQWGPGGRPVRTPG